MADSAGAMRERLLVQENTAPTVSVSSLTRSGTTATAATAIAHGYVATDYVTIAGSTTPGWNGKWRVASVPTTTSFTFVVPATLTTPATGTITVAYLSNAQGGRGSTTWRTLDSVAAEMIPLRAWERLELQQIYSESVYRFRIRARGDLRTTMRVLWTPSWPAGMPRQTLEINGILPDPENIAYQLINAAQVPA